MKKIYMKPAICSVAAFTEGSLLDAASSTFGSPNDCKITDSDEEEVDAAAKGGDWSDWD